tara:strand:- start:315 stop:809 length:495 start_codon:yes stop_codon:yes gene_type:complete
MKLNKSSWHYKVYAFNSQLVAAWQNQNSFHRYPYHGKIIGLCPYMRMIIIWGPLVFLCNLAPLVAAVGVFIVLPVTTIGAMSQLIVVATIVGFVVAACLIIGGANYLAGRLGDMEELRAEQQKKTKLESAANGVTPPETFWSLLVSYITSLKTKVCPVLELDDE